MKFIGVTGGVGAGKTELLHYIETTYPAKVVLADTLAQELMQPNKSCFQKLSKEFLGLDVFTNKGTFDKEKMASLIFADEGRRKRLNEIVHPAVKEEVLRQVEEEEIRGEYQYFILEAALLIEEGYHKLCQELWYISASEEIRRKRLKNSRGYSDEKIEGIFKSQLPEETYRKYCVRVISNDKTLEEAFRQIDRAFNILETVNQGDKRMEKSKTEQSLVFGLDIGTRNVVGTVGYKIDKEFIVLAQHCMEHETRSMLDGQIHDIGRVGRTIRTVKESLESQIGQELSTVCIAAAGRVLKTVTTRIDFEFEEETVVEGEDIHTLDLLGIEKAQGILREKNDTKYKFYCVGYSVVKYFLNDEIFSNLEGHKAEKIAEDIIVTFLPEDVVDGLYAAVGMAGLDVVNMTLEPIAAIDIAIPENYRMLNIALVDVGAGTSDISITKDGSIIAYGMIPLAGDEMTELLVQKYLVDFNMAEHIKLESTRSDEIEYTDIMSLPHKIKSQEVWDLTEPLVDRITTDVAEKIKELNGEQTVSATFVVGGGGKIHGFTTMLAEKLGLPYERVALRGEEVLQEVTFEQPDIKKDPLLVTPIGICLNYYEQRNSFIMVHFNGERIKLYDNNRLTIVDAAMQAGFPNDQLFPKRGKEINFTVNGRPRIARGEAGESAIVKVNDKPANINSPLLANSYITVEPSTAGEEAKVTIENLKEYTRGTVNFIVNNKHIRCPKFVEVNGSIVLPSYEVQEGDVIETRNFYTVEQLAEFMDVEVNTDYAILVNNRSANRNTLVYENFTIEWTAETKAHAEGYVSEQEIFQAEEAEVEEEITLENVVSDTNTAEVLQASTETTTDLQEEKSSNLVSGKSQIVLNITVNGSPIKLTGKMTYVFIDVFDFIDFDLSAANGRAIVTTLNGGPVEYTKGLESGDAIEIYWKENK